MDVLLKPAVDAYNYAFVELADRRMDNRCLVSSPWPLVAICVGYYYFVFYGGRYFMKDRKPFDISSLMVPYNALQTLCNGAMFLNGMRLLFLYDRSLTCITVNYDESNYFTKQFTYLTYYFFLLKVSDLFDTVFMVMKKNYHQITFLHVYHHLLMVTVSWIVTKYLPGGHTLIFGLINSGVHAVMYFYYFLSSKYPEYKKSIWWKKHITQIQMIQFAVVFFHLSLAFFDPLCNYPKFLLLVFMSQNVLMFYLFAKFYYKAYILSDNKSQTVTNGTAKKQE